MKDRGILQHIGGKNDLLVAGGIVFIIMMLIIPLPTILLDFLMAMNITLSLLIILIVLYTKNALEFSVFPTMLLVSSVFGLALNISSTRLILAQGSTFNGKMIQAFSRFVVGSSGSEGLVIGFIIFLILIAVQFLVITKGSTRVAEVAARFTLDSLPGKQMAIEAEFNTGTLTEEQMLKKKMDLEREVDFYGAMDGASKFVSGNVKVGILITIVNIIGGLIVGMTIHQESLSVAVSTYVSLTIGDGLVTQIPALLISTATGLIVTRSISEGTFGEDVSQQFSSQSRIYWIAGFFLAMLSLLPGFPWYLLMPLAALTLFLAYRFSRKAKEETVQEPSMKQEEADIPIIPPLDSLSLEIGYGLVPLVDASSGAELLDRITGIRREIALELGLVIPRIRIVDNMRLQATEYFIKIRGTEMSKGSIRMGHYLAINPGNVSEEITGEETKDPTFGLPALWISEDMRRKAEQAGYTVVDAPSIITTHLAEIVKNYAADILGRQEVRTILDRLQEQYSAVVEEVQKQLTLGEIHKVLQLLLREKISIRDMVSILETISDYASVNKDATFLTEKARQALARQISTKFADAQNVLHVIVMNAESEQLIANARSDMEGRPAVSLDPGQYRTVIQALKESVQVAQGKGFLPILLCSEMIRPFLRELCNRDFGSVPVLSVAEIASFVTVKAVATLELKEGVTS